LATAAIPPAIFGFGLARETLPRPATSRFAKGKFDDSKWRSLNLPHDWAVELPFVHDEEEQSHGYKPLGRRYPETSVGWYRGVRDSGGATRAPRING
jgi:beta-galactosidase